MAENAVYNERVVVMTGYYDLRGTYKYLVSYLEDSLFYDVSEKDYDEKNDQGKRGITSIVEATRHRDDGVKFVLKFKCEFKGKDVKDKNLQKGTAKLTMNTYVKVSEDEKASKWANFLDMIKGRFVTHRDLGDASEELAKEAAGVLERLKSQFKETP